MMQRVAAMNRVGCEDVHPDFPAFLGEEPPT
jgi:hypothetical protein